LYILQLNGRFMAVSRHLYHVHTHSKHQSDVYTMMHVRRPVWRTCLL